jgi:hypothetical protein
VQEATGAGVEEPTADITVTLKDFAFDLPETLPAGPTTIKVVNDGPEPHEMNLLLLADGKTDADVMQYLGAPAGPPPFTPVGGMNGFDPGSVGYVELDFKPGNYVAICNIPSPNAGGRPHFALGMIKAFTVASPKFLYGTYMSENGSTDLQLNSDGTWLMIYRGETADKGTFSVQGDKFTFETSLSCGADGKAAYTWAQTNGTLVLTVKAESDDPCGARRLAMNAIKFSLKP